jgi:hypothetical protein
VFIDVFGVELIMVLTNLRCRKVGPHKAYERIGKSSLRVGKKKKICFC